MKRMGSWMVGMMAATSAAAAHAESALEPMLGNAMMTDEPQSGVLAVVGVGLLVLSAFAKRRRDP